MEYLRMILGSWVIVVLIVELSKNFRFINFKKYYPDENFSELTKFEKHSKKFNFTLPPKRNINDS